MNQKPTDAELEILQILWKRSPATVREINDEINRSRETGYTTTLKILQIMHSKGLVKREKEGKTHFYEASEPQKKTQKALLSRFMDTAFSGSAGNLILQALGTGKTSKEELQEIRAMLEEIEKDKE